MFIKYAILDAPQFNNLKSKEKRFAAPLITFLRKLYKAKDTIGLSIFGQ